MSKQVPVLCDHDALFAAIELKLSALAQVQVLRLEANHPQASTGQWSTAEFAMIIVAPVPPIKDPMSILSRASLLGHVGQVPVLIISEQPTRPESDDKITYLNFPFDMDDLTDTVAGILGDRRHADPERGH